MSPKETIKYGTEWIHVQLPGGSWDGSFKYLKEVRVLKLETK